MDQLKVIEDEKRHYTSHDICAVNSISSSLSRASSNASSRTAHDLRNGHVDDRHKSSATLEFDFNPPNGGWLAWSQVLAANLANAVSWGYAATFGVYQLYYVDTMGLKSAQVSWIGSIQVFLAFVVCGPSGRIADAGYSREIIIVGCFFVVLGSYMTSFCYEFWHIMLAQGICTGIGLGVISTPAVAITSSYFSTRKSLALSISAMGTSAGGVIFPSIVQYLIPQIGFSWATRVGALVALVCCIGACVLLKPYLPGRKTGPWVEWAAFKEVPYALFSAGSFLNFYGMYFGLFYINSFARNVIGFSSVESVSLLLITNAIGLPVRPIVGYVANTHIGPINIFIMATAFVGVMLFVWTTVTTRTSMYVFSVFYGLAISASQSTYVPSLASLTLDPQKMGIRFGMVETLCAFSTLAGPPTAGAIIDRTGSYTYAQIWGGSVMLSAALVLAAVRFSLTGWKWKFLT